MNRHAFPFVALLLFQAVLFAQQPARGLIDITCPLDDFKFTWPTPQAASQRTGYDSDLCTYQSGPFAPAQGLVICPHCNYTDFLSKFAKTTLDGQTRDKLLAALATSTYRGVQNSAVMIPVWERCRLGELCARTRDVKASERIDYPLLGVYAIRVESTRLASTTQLFGDPLHNTFYFARVERTMLEEQDPAQRAQLKLELAMFAQRMGLPDERERWLRAASEDTGATPALKTAIDTFRNMTKLEISFQRALVSVLDEALVEKEVTPDRRAFYVYLKADTLRRLGDLKQAAQGFWELRDSTVLSQQMRDFVGYFAVLLKDQLPEKAEEKK